MITGFHLTWSMATKLNQLHPTLEAISDPLTGLAAPSEVDREMEVRSELEADSVCSSWDPSQSCDLGFLGMNPFAHCCLIHLGAGLSTGRQHRIKTSAVGILIHSCLHGVISQEVILRMLKCGFKMFGRLFFKTRFSIRRVFNTAVLGLWIFWLRYAKT